MCVNGQNFHVSEEIGVEEHDGDVRSSTGNRNMAISHMCNEKYAILSFFNSQIS